jgi:hypothetical protein
VFSIGFQMGKFLRKQLNSLRSDLNPIETSDRQIRNSRVSAKQSLHFWNGNRFEGRISTQILGSPTSDEDE